MFDYDWFFGTAFEQQQTAARFRVAARKFPDLTYDEALKNDKCRREMEALGDEFEARLIEVLKDEQLEEFRQIREERQSMLKGRGSHRRGRF